MVAAAAIGFLAARALVGTKPPQELPEIATAAPAQKPKPAHSNTVEAAAASPLPSLPGAETTLAQAFDALAARARRGDLAANDRLLRGLVRCRTYGQSGYNPYHESRTETQISADAAALRTTFESGRVFCNGLSQAERQSEAEWLERAAESGDAEAMLCFAVEPPMGRLRTLSPEWVETRRRYIAFARGYAERAFERGYASAAWALYASYAAASPDPAMRTYSIPPGPPDLARAYAFARLQADRLRGDDRLRSGIAAQWADRADLLAMRLSPQERERAEAFVRKQAARPTPPSRGLCYNAIVLP
jgi:hypothetical protein